MDITSIIRNLIIAAPAILIAITFHEIAHGYVANKLGDPTAKMMGRLSLNPLAHIDPIGTVLVPIMLFIMSNGTFMFGAAKPVPVNFLNLRNPKRDSALVSVAGPATNVIIAFVAILLFKTVSLFEPSSPNPATLGNKIFVPLSYMIYYMIQFNIFIAAFNLLPIPPLDGGRIVTSLLPTKHAYEFSKLEPYGMLIVIGLWVIGIARYIIVPLQMLIEFILRIMLIPFGGM
jgi:Zn-dependent protease